MKIDKYQKYFKQHTYFHSIAILCGYFVIFLILGRAILNLSFPLLTPFLRLHLQLNHFWSGKQKKSLNFTTHHSKRFGQFTTINSNPLLFVVFCYLPVALRFCVCCCATRVKTTTSIACSTTSEESDSCVGDDRRRLLKVDGSAEIISSHFK